MQDCLNLMVREGTKGAVANIISMSAHGRQSFLAAIREWVDAPGVRYVPVDGELDLLPGLRLVPAPGHTPGLQIVVIETGGRPIVVGGDVAVWFGKLDGPSSEGQFKVLALDPELVWLAHTHEPWRPAPRQA